VLLKASPCLISEQCGGKRFPSAPPLPTRHFQRRFQQDDFRTPHYFQAETGIMGVFISPYFSLQSLFTSSALNLDLFSLMVTEARAEEGNQ
jgi:hypothetical protein